MQSNIELLSSFGVKTIESTNYIMFFQNQNYGDLKTNDKVGTNTFLVGVYKIRTFFPNIAKRNAAESPDRPAPMTATSYVLFSTAC